MSRATSELSKLVADYRAKRGLEPEGPPEISKAIRAYRARKEAEKVMAGWAKLASQGNSDTTAVTQYEGPFVDCNKPTVDTTPAAEQPAVTSKPSRRPVRYRPRKVPLDPCGGPQLRKRDTVR
jgi:hypothetical protein